MSTDGGSLFVWFSQSFGAAVEAAGQTKIYKLQTPNPKPSNSYLGGSALHQRAGDKGEAEDSIEASSWKRGENRSWRGEEGGTALPHGPE